MAEKQLVVLIFCGILSFYQQFGCKKVGGTFITIYISSICLSIHRCGHCKKLAPEYEEAATALKTSDPPIKLAKVDATEEKELGDKFGVTGYPTLKMFRKGKEYEYKGPREAQGMLVFL